MTARWNAGILARGDIFPMFDFRLTALCAMALDPLATALAAPMAGANYEGWKPVNQGNARYEIRVAEGFWCRLHSAGMEELPQRHDLGDSDVICARSYLDIGRDGPMVCEASPGLLPHVRAARAPVGLPTTRGTPTPTTPWSKRFQSVRCCHSSG
jgi:hypothetical protein